jgi:3',5'-cyclic AMP phosphodiesterase CpdA
MGNRTDSFSIAHITDAHVAPFGKANATLKHLSLAIFEDLVEQCRERADLVLFGGDNIDNRGYGEEDLEAFLELVEPLQGRWFAQFGNHEAASRRSGRLDKHAFAAAAAGRGVAPGAYDFSVVVGDVRVIGIDTTLVGSPSGFVSPETLRFMAREIERAEEPHVVVLGHHPLHPAWEPHALDSWDREYLVANREMVSALLASAPRVRAYLCGHHHASRIQRVRGRGRSGGYHHFQTASPIAYPHTSRLLRFTADAIHVSPLVPRLDGLLEEGASWVETGRKARRYGQLGAEASFLEYLSGGPEDNEVVLPLEPARRARPASPSAFSLGTRSKLRR